MKQLLINKQFQSSKVTIKAVKYDISASQSHFYETNQSEHMSFYWARMWQRGCHAAALANVKDIFYMLELLKFTVILSLTSSLIASCHFHMGICTVANSASDSASRLKRKPSVMILYTGNVKSERANTGQNTNKMIYWKPEKIFWCVFAKKSIMAGLLCHLVCN